MPQNQPTAVFLDGCEIPLARLFGTPCRFCRLYRYDGGENRTGHVEFQHRTEPTEPNLHTSLNSAGGRDWMAGTSRPRRRRPMDRYHDGLAFGFTHPLLAV